MNMVVVIKSLGIAFALIGIAYLFHPDILKTLMHFFKKGKRVYIAGLIRFVLAVVFLLAATQCEKPMIIGAFGIIFLLSGVLIFILGPEKIRRIFEWYEKQSKIVFQIIALIVIIVGSVIIFSA